jgi:site-specific DNA recombinase
VGTSRYIPFGYCISGGEIVVNAGEAEIIKQIYTFYLSGKSYLAIARIMQSENTRYSINADWNKNNIGRILHNERYQGNEKYPRIVDKAVFDKARIRIEGNSSQKAITNSAELVSLRGLMHCNNCGGRMNNRDGKWLCVKCESKAKLKNDDLPNGLMQLINRLIACPDLVNIPPFKSYSPNMEIKRLENEINRELEKPGCNEEYIKSLIQSLVDLKYSVCDDGSSGRQGERIRELLLKSKCGEKLNIELLTSIAKRIIVQKDGGFFIILKNGQKMK